MQMIQVGQCGLCLHFGEYQNDPKVFQIRLKHEAAENLIEECGHPKLAPLHLKVTPISGCQGFEAAPELPN